MVKIADALQNISLLFLDTAPVIYFVEKHPTYFPTVQYAFEQIDNGSVVAVTSPVTLAECLIIPYRQSLFTLQNDFSDLITSGRNTLFALIDDVAARRAAELRARYNLSLTDSFQIAVALQTKCEAFLTNDIALARVNELRVLVLDELEL